MLLTRTPNNHQIGRQLRTQDHCSVQETLRYHPVLRTTGLRHPSGDSVKYVANTVLSGVRDVAVYFSARWTTSVRYSFYYVVSERGLKTIQS